MNNMKTCPQININHEQEILENIVQKLCKLTLTFMFCVHVCTHLCAVSCAYLCVQESVSRPEADVWCLSLPLSITYFKTITEPGAYQLGLGWMICDLCRFPAQTPQGWDSGLILPYLPF